jgi:nucleotide-binding universal stress UspA family protein
MSEATAKLFRRIVVAYDGSTSAEDALCLALRLREPSDGRVMLACVVPSRSWHLPGRASTCESATAEAEAMLAEARTKIQAGVPVVIRAPAAASPARGVTEVAETEHADLIVIGSAKGAADGRIGLARTAGRLLAGAPCAVAVAPPGLRESGPFHHVGVALDGSAEAAAALQAAYVVARQSGSAVSLFSALDETIDPSPDDALHARLAIQERLDSAADSAPAGVNPRTVLLHGAAGREIAGACDGVVDLLITGSRSYGPVQRALLGSVSEELIARARHPVLVIPRQPPGPARGGDQADHDTRLAGRLSP